MFPCMCLCLKGKRGGLESESNALFSDVPYGVRVTGASATESVATEFLRLCLHKTA